MSITATDAKNRFGQVLAQGSRRPVLVEDAGCPHRAAPGVEQERRDALDAVPSGA